jgi:hypothetical protein
MNNRWYRVKITGGDGSCPQSIFSNEVKLSVIPRPTLRSVQIHPFVQEIQRHHCHLRLQLKVQPITPLTGLQAGLTNVTNAAFPGSSPITIAINPSAIAGTYHGTITVKNGSCTSAAVNFSVIINAKPAAPTLVISSN